MVHCNRSARNHALSHQVTFQGNKLPESSRLTARTRTDDDRQTDVGLTL